MRWIVLIGFVAAVPAIVEGESPGRISCVEYIRIIESGSLAERERVSDYVSGFMDGAKRQTAAQRSAMQSMTAKICREHPDYWLTLALFSASAVLVGVEK